MVAGYWFFQDEGQFPKGTGKLETQLACHLHPGAASKTKMTHGDNPPYACEPTPGGNRSLTGQKRQLPSEAAPSLPCGVKAVF